MPNALAYLALFGFPLLALILFRKNAVPAALIWTVLLGLLMLPTRVSFDLPLLPALDKNSVPALSAMVLSMMVLARQKPLGRQGQAGDQTFHEMGRWLPQSWLLKALLAIFFIGPVATVMTNADGYVVGGRYLPGLRPYDAMSVLLSSFIGILPLFLARRFLATTQAQVMFLKILCVAMMAYALLALVEIRLSPQLNRWIYGFFPHSFVQHIRGGGFRPLVFMTHGLVLGLMFAMALLAALGMWRTHKRATLGYVVLGVFWLLAVLILSKTLSALVIVLLIAPVIVFFGIRFQLLTAALVAGLVLAYPILRGNDLVPTDRILSVARDYNPTRAASLEFRFKHEDSLLERAKERPVFGWGGWGRSRLFDEWTGDDVSTTDGIWVITIGVGGWVGYIARFGLLTLPLMLLAQRRKSLDIGMVTSVLCLIQAANLIDLIPNSGLTPITWLIAGALWGRYELGREVEDAPAGVATAARPASPYRRQFGPDKALSRKPHVQRSAHVRLPNGVMKQRRP